MSATALVAARMEPELRDRAKALLERDGMTESRLIRRVYEYVVHLGRVPEFLKTGEFDMVMPLGGDDKFDELLFLIESNPFNAYDFTAVDGEELKRDRADALDSMLGAGNE